MKTKEIVERCKAGPMQWDQSDINQLIKALESAAQIIDGLNERCVCDSFLVDVAKEWLVENWKE